MEGFPGTASSQTNLQVKFPHQHPRDIIVILEGGNQPHPPCLQCYIFVPQEALNQEHLTSAMCLHSKYRKLQRLVVEETEENMGIGLSVYSTLLMRVP